jgi:dTDP-3-amino-3,4,6-trideoxy-alpha-D-glucose transaminase
VGRRLATQREAIEAAVERVVASQRVLLGDETEAFEHEFASFTGQQHAVAVASGTDALRLILVALEIGPGHEVIVPAFTAVPTAAAVCAAGATPVPVDVDDATAGIDAAAVERAITGATKAVIVVHLYGRPMDLPDVGLPIIDDAAQAHGALDARQQRRGPESIAAAYSFYPTKNLGGIGDGGAVVTSDRQLAERVRLLRAHGLQAEYRHTVIATNSRMSELEAAVLRAGLRCLPEGNARRAAIAAALRAAAPGLRWQSDHPRHAHHLCVARVANRDEFRARVPFETATHYPLAITQQPAYSHLARFPCPNAEAWAAECVSLPCFPELTDDEVAAVASALRQLA